MKDNKNSTYYAKYMLIEELLSSVKKASIDKNRNDLIEKSNSGKPKFIRVSSSSGYYI